MASYEKALKMDLSSSHSSVPLTRQNLRKGPLNLNHELVDDRLAQACKDGNLGMVEGLLKKPLWSSGQLQTVGMAPITCALQNEHLILAGYLVHCGADVNARNDQGITPLHACTEFDTHLQAVRWLLRKGAHLEEQDDQGRTALFCAVGFGSRKIVSLLLSRGANVEASDFLGQSVLHIAAVEGKPSSIKKLGATVANMNKVDRWGNTPLMRAAENGHAASVRALIIHGAKVNEKNAFGITALHHAARAGYMEIASMLIQHHAGKDVGDHHGVTPRAMAAFHGSEGVFRAFNGDPSEENNAMNETGQIWFYSSDDFDDCDDYDDSSSSDDFFSSEDSDYPDDTRRASMFEEGIRPRLRSSRTTRKELFRDSRLPVESRGAEYPRPFGPTDDNSMEFGELLQDHRDYRNEDQVPFQHTRILGDGAFARVDEVRAESASGFKAGRLFARKLIHIRLHSELLTRENIEKEVSILRKLRNPHVVRIVTTYTRPNPEVFAMIMHPVANYHLDDFLNRHYNCTITDKKKMLSWFGCLAMGLEYLHSCGIRHKDIKPENLLVHGDNILFADFGLSRDSLDETSTTSGPVQARTAMYCAPEVADEERRGKSSDVFSLGCCFLEMITLLCGKSLDNFRKFRETDGKRSYHANIKKVLGWLLVLGRGPVAELRDALGRVAAPGNVEAIRDLKIWEENQLHILLLLNCCYTMLQPKKEKRFDAKQLLLLMKGGSGHIRSTSKVCGDCCRKTFLYHHGQLRIPSTPDWTILAIEKSPGWDEVNERWGYDAFFSAFAESCSVDLLDSRGPLPESARGAGALTTDAESATDKRLGRDRQSAIFRNIGRFPGPSPDKRLGRDRQNAIFRNIGRFPGPSPDKRLGRDRQSAIFRNIGRFPGPSPDGFRGSRE